MKKLGIIVARFQVPALHAGHIHFITEAAKKSDELVIFLGYKVNQPDIKNPFSLAIRKAMVVQTLSKLNLTSKVVVDSLEDNPISHECWSSELDKKIEAYKEQFLKTSKEDIEVSLFGSRDSFAKSYFGKNQTVHIEEMVTVSGTEKRNGVLSLKEEDLSEAHREGIVYGLKNIYPVGMSVVDVAVYKKVDGVFYFLFGRKPRETFFRLIGGFFDVEQDETLEDAALRELREEVGGIVVGEPQYLMSKKIDDWRYRDNQHKIVSSLFIVEYISGDPAPGDDIEELKWFSLEETMKEILEKNHLVFIEKVIAHIGLTS